MSLAVTYSDLKRQVGRDLFGQRTPASLTADQLVDVNDCIADGMRMVYGVHEWSFLFPTRSLTTSAPYSTGTITVVDGVVTLAGDGAVFPSHAADCEIIPSTGTAGYTVNTRDSDTQLTLDDTTLDVAAGTSYELARVAYALPGDFGGIAGPATYRAGTNNLYPPLPYVPEHIVRVNQQLRASTGRPARLAVRPRAHATSAPTVWEMLVDPPADAAYELTYRYHAIALFPTADGEYLPGGALVAQALIDACLAATEPKIADTIGPKMAAFQASLAKAIAADKRAGAPEHFGPYGDPSQRSSEPLARCNKVTYNGVLYDGS